MKLLRLKGDITRSTNPDTDREIVNRFTPSVTVEPGSSIALAGIDLTILADNQLPESSTLTWNTVDIGLTSATYTDDQIKEYLTSIIAFSAGTLDANATNNIIVDQDSRNRLTFTQTLTGTALLPYDSQYQLLSGTPVVDDQGSFDANASADHIEMYSQLTVPNAGFRFYCEFADDQQVGFHVLDNTPSIDLFCGVEIDANANYQAYFNGTQVDTGVPVEANGCQVTLDYSRNTITIRINDAAGNALYTNAETITRTQWIAYCYPNNLVSYLIAPAGSTAVISGSKGTLLDYNDEVNEIDMSFTTELRKFLGFYSNPDPEAGLNPEIVAFRPYGDYIQNAGIMVVVDPFSLESFDGAKDSTYQPNILYVLHNPEYRSHSFARKTVRLDVPRLIPLRLKNDEPFQLTEIRMRFQNSSTGDSIQFTRDPIATVLILGPEDL